MPVNFYTQKTLKTPLKKKKTVKINEFTKVEGDQPWVFFGGNDAKAEAPVLWPPHAKSWLMGKDSDGRKRRKTKEPLDESERRE